MVVVGFSAGLSPTSFHLSPRLGACGRVLVSHFLSFVSQAWSGSRPACLPLPSICLPVLFFSFVSQAGCLWWGFGLACLPLPCICLPLLFICLPGWVLVVGFPAGLSPTSFHLSPRLGACGRVPGRLVSHLLDLSPTSFQLSPTSFHLSPSSFHLSPRLGACGRVPGWLVSHFLSFVSRFFSLVCLPGRVPAGSRLACLPLPFASFHLYPSSFHLSPRLGACGGVFGRLVSHFLSIVSNFFSWVLVVGLVSHFLSFVSQARCLWSGSRPACLPLPFNCLPLLFICLPECLWSASRGFPAGLSPTSFPAGLSPTSLHLSPTFSPNSLLLGVLNSFLILKMCPPFVSLLVSAHFHWLAGRVAFLFICLPGLSLLVSALFHWGCDIYIHLSPRSVTGGVRPFPLAMQEFCSFVSQVCHC